MRIMAAQLVVSFSMLATPAAAAHWVCPAPQALPASLNLSTEGEGKAHARSMQKLQAYLNNLKNIKAQYSRVRTKGGRNQVANCMVYHLATLTDTNALQSPQTRADGAAWFLLKDEAHAALQDIDPRFFPHNIHVTLIRQWLSRQPAYGPATPYAVSSR